MRAILYIFLIACINNVYAQSNNDAPIAHASSHGVYLELSYDYPPALPTPVKGFKIERKTAADKKWITIGQFDAPLTKDAFLANLSKANAYIPEFIDKDAVPYDDIWSKLEKYHTIDSIPVWRNALIVKLALGLTAYDGTVPEQTQVEYRISRVMENGNIETYATTAQISTPGKYPFAEMNSTDISSSTEQITLRYHATDNTLPSFFRVYRSEQPDGEFYPIRCIRYFSTTDRINELVFTDTNVIANHLYYYKIAPMTYYGALGELSQPTPAAAYDPRQIQLPRDVRVGYQTGKPGLTVRWDIKSTQNISGYNIYRGTKQNGPFEKIGFASVMDTGYHDNYAEPLVTYYYYIETIDRLGNALFPTATVPGIFRSEMRPMPPFVSATGVENGVMLEIRLKAGDIRGYRIYRSAGNDTTKTPVSDLVAYNDKDDVTTFTDNSKSLNGKTFYSYYVKAESKSYAFSAFSEPATARPLIKTEVLPAIQVEVEQQNGRNIITWVDVNTEVYGHQIFRKTGNGTPQMIGEASSRYFIDSTANAMEVYTYQVITTDQYGGRSPMSMGATTTVQNNVVIETVSIIAYASAGKIMIEWSAMTNSDKQGINIYRYEGSGKPTIIATSTIDALKWEDKNVTKGHNYHYYITVTTDGKEGAPSNEVGVVVE